MRIALLVNCLGDTLFPAVGRSMLEPLGIAGCRAIPRRGPNGEPHAVIDQRVATLAEAVAGIADGSTVTIGAFGSSGISSGHRVACEADPEARTASFQYVVTRDRGSRGL